MSSDQSKFYTDTNNERLNIDLSRWKEYFYPDCLVQGKYYDVSDGSSILVVSSCPNQKNLHKTKIILIPGWFSQPSGWIQIIKSVSEHLEVIYIETREKNTSIVKKDKNTKMGIDQMAKDVEEIFSIMNLDISQAICVGSSLGGSTLLKFIETSKIKPKKTILVGPNPDFKLPPIIGKILLSMPLFMIGIAKRYIKWHMLKFKLDPINEPEQAEKYIEIFDAADSWKIKQSAKHVTKFNAWSFLSSIKADVIVVGASLDKLHASERTLNVGRLIPNSKFIDFKSNKATHSTEFGNFIVDVASERDILEMRLSSQVEL